jgi:multiple sugar transport system substrate-binding protein
MREPRKAAAVVVIVGALLTGCGGGGGDTGGDDGGSGKITLSFPSFQADEPGTSTFWKEAIAKYQADHANVSIKMENVSGSDWSDALATRYIGQDPPDITHLLSRDFDVFAARGWFAELDDCLQDSGVLTDWTTLQDKMKWEDKTQGVLLLSYAYELYFNKKMLADAGIDSPPTTPEEFVAAVEAVNKNGDLGFAGLTTTDKETFTEASMFVTGMGASWTKDGAYNLTDPKLIEALDVWRQIEKTAPEGMGEQQRNELFLNGEAAMMLDGNYFWSYIQESAIDKVRDNAGVTSAPFPTAPGAVSNSLHIPASLTGAKFDAACDFLKLVSTPEMQQRYTQLVKVPAPRKGSVTDEDLEKTPELKLMLDDANRAVSVYPPDPTVTQNYGEFSKIVIDGLVRLVSSDDDTKSVMTDIQGQLEQAVPLK